MMFERDPQWGGYFIRKMTLPVGAEGGIENGMLRLGCLDFRPFVTQTRDGNQATLAGSVLIVMEAIMSALHIHNATIVSNLNEPFEQRLSNGTVAGIMGRIQRQEVDICINPIIASDRRMLYLDPTDLMIDGLQLLVFKPKKAVHPFSFVRAFHPNVWLTLFICINLTALSMFLMDRYLVRGRYGIPPAALASYLWELWRRLFPQDPMRRKDNWLRICLLLFMFAIPMQLLVVFSGVLTSSMTVREPEDHIKTAEDVLRFKNLRVYAEARTSLSLLFLYPTSELFRKLATRYVPITGSLTIEPSFFPRLEEIERREATIIGNENLFAPMIEKLKIHRGGVCPHLAVTESSFGTLIVSMAIRQSLPREMRRKFTRGVRGIIETHVFPKAQEWILRKTYACLKARDEAQTTLTLNDLHGSFTVWGLGIACSLVCILAELSVRNRATCACRTRRGK